MYLAHNFEYPFNESKGRIFVEQVAHRVYKDMLGLFPRQRNFQVLPSIQDEVAERMNRLLST